MLKLRFLIFAAGVLLILAFLHCAKAGPADPKFHLEQESLLSDHEFDLSEPAIFVIKECGKGLMLFAWMKGKMRVGSRAEIQQNINGITDWMYKVAAAIRKREGSDTTWQTELEKIKGTKC